MEERCPRQLCSIHCGMAGGCPLHIANSGTIYQQLAEAREWRRAQAALPESRVSSRVVDMIPTSLEPVLQRTSTPRPRQSPSSTFRQSRATLSVLSQPSSSHTTVSFPSSKWATSRVSQSRHTSSTPTPRHRLSQPPLKRTRLGRESSSPILVLDSEAEVAALLEETGQIGDGPTQASLEDLKVSRDYWAENVGDNTLTPLGPSRARPSGPIFPRTPCNQRSHIPWKPPFIRTATIIFLASIIPCVLGTSSNDLPLAAAKAFTQVKTPQSSKFVC